MVLTTDWAREHDPPTHIVKGGVVVSHGTLESPEFQRQARDFVAAASAAGKPVALLAGEDYNHFEIIETLASPYGLLGRAALELMRLPQGDAR